MTERAYAWKNAIFAGLFFGLFFGLFMGWNNGWLPPQTGGDVAGTLTMMLVSGGMFGLIMGLFALSPIVPKAQDIALMPGETLEHTGLANHFRNLEARGGRLALTSTHLVFQPHAINLQHSDVRIPREEIASVETTRTLGVVPNGLKVTLKSGKSERFVVNERDVWVAKLGAR